MEPFKEAAKGEKKGVLLDTPTISYAPFRAPRAFSEGVRRCSLMIALWFGFALFLLFALAALLGYSIWVYELILAIRLLREQRLWRELVRPLFRTAIATNGSTLFAFYCYLFFVPLEGINAIQSDFRFDIVLWGSLGLFVATLPLWCWSIVLSALVRRRPIYVFLLPQDAGKVRLQHCASGMYFATLLLPKILPDELLDPFFRAIAVSARAETYPVGNCQRIFVTNEFGVYCDLVVEAASKGYHTMCDLFEQDRARYDELVPLIKASPEATQEQKQQLDALARQVLYGDEETSSPDQP